jgi:hypothetical protein
MRPRSLPSRGLWRYHDLPSLHRCQLVTRKRLFIADPDRLRGKPISDLLHRGSASDYRASSARIGKITRQTRDAVGAYTRAAARVGSLNTRRAGWSFLTPPIKVHCDCSQLMYKLIVIIAAAMPIVLVLRAIFTRRSPKSSRAFSEFKKQIDYLVWVILFGIGCVFIYSVANLIHSMWR